MTDLQHGTGTEQGAGTRCEGVLQPGIITNRSVFLKVISVPVRHKDSATQQVGCAKPRGQPGLAQIWHNPRMCGRYRLSRRKQIIEEYFDSAPWDEDWSPRYNIAPTQPVPVIRQNPKNNVRELSLMRWGLIPHWAKEASIAMSTINAKSETAATKPGFRDPLKFRRCLIPADGFYEWKRTASGKQPYCFEVREGSCSLLLACGMDGRIQVVNG